MGALMMDADHRCQPATAIKQQIEEEDTHRCGGHRIRQVTGFGVVVACQIVMRIQDF